ncbi:alcohol dehydrogenase [Strigomonas culicis]|uniref:Alcohol dehydrogenase 4 n=1 Tax=Strigomonas culicis TaxID=28005 RepID=S9V597_9TRYP|nr:alcohol dehydrogenase [Strigomonas culicis]|eukprot:EPY36239.1 alcohol dehydrogenase [Strigomonas culicis]
MPVSLFWRVVHRAAQNVLYLGLFLLPWQRPQLLKGKGALKQLPAFIKGKRLRHALLVTDSALMRLGLANGFLEQMKAVGVKVSVYKDVTPNPTVAQAEEACSLYRAQQCDHIIAFGGGSPIDCAKVVGARVVRPRTSVQRLRGLFRVLWPLPPLFAVPTTAGTGSECTLAAVIVDGVTHEKSALMDPFLVPHYAVLDPCLTTGLPPFITATTGIDTLTHGVEAFLNLNQVRQTEEDARKAVRLVFQHLRRAYDDGTDMVAREGMQEAAYLGGLACTRACVGNVHALAHQLGGLYNVPHGYANGVLLPHVLELYGPAVHSRLAQLADYVGVAGGSTAEKAQALIRAIKEMNAHMQIPETFAGDPHFSILDRDIPLMVSRALAEVNP